MPPHLFSVKLKDVNYLRFLFDNEDMLDCLGRPLHEASFRRSGRKEENIVEVKECPYFGIRSGFKINHTAFVDMSKQWSERLGGYVWIHDLFKKRASKVDFDIFIGWQAVYGLTVIPSYLCYKRENFIEKNQIPSLIASVYKTALDFSSVLEIIMVESFSENSKESVKPLDHGYVNVVAERSGILLNEDWGCAGSPKMIEELSKLLIENKFNRNASCLEIKKLLNKEQDRFTQQNTTNKSALRLTD